MLVINVPFNLSHHFFILSPFSPHRDLYPALVRTLQSVHSLQPSSDPLPSLQIQRLSALLSLLTQVTHTAGCHQELQAGAGRYREETTQSVRSILLFLHVRFVFTTALEEKNTRLRPPCPGVRSLVCRRPCWDI